MKPQPNIRLHWEVFGEQRKALGLTQAEIADKSNKYIQHDKERFKDEPQWTKQYVSNLETGKFSSLHTKSLERACVAYGLRVTDILF